MNHLDRYLEGLVVQQRDNPHICRDTFTGLRTPRGSNTLSWVVGHCSGTEGP